MFRHIETQFRTYSNEMDHELDEIVKHLQVCRLIYNRIRINFCLDSNFNDDVKWRRTPEAVLDWQKRVKELKKEREKIAYEQEVTFSSRNICVFNFPKYHRYKMWTFIDN